MVEDAAKPSQNAMWSRAIAGLKHEGESEEEPKQEPAVQEPKPDLRKQPRVPREIADEVNKESDAKLVAAMRARIQQEQEQRHRYTAGFDSRGRPMTQQQLIQMQHIRQQQAQAQQAPMPQPNPALVQQVLQARQATPHPQAQPHPRPRWRGMEKTSAMLTTGTGICKSWKASRKQKKR